MRSEINLHRGDCMEALRGMADNSYDLAIVDPPYGIKMDSRGMNGRQANGRHRATQSQYAVKEYDDNPPEQSYFDELRRVSKSQIVWGANHFISLLPIDSPCWIVWFKNGQSMAPCNADCELAWTSFKTPVKMFRLDWCGFGHINAGEKRTHPNQKPVALYKWLLSNYAKEGDKILDTHLGSGSIAIACWDAGYDLTGYELDEDYYDAACARLAKHKAQGQFDI